MPIATLSGAVLAGVHQALATKLVWMANISDKHTCRWQSITASAFMDHMDLLGVQEIELGGA